jgi:hypothetical protein
MGDQPCKGLSVLIKIIDNKIDQYYLCGEIYYIKFTNFSRGLSRTQTLKTHHECKTFSHTQFFSPRTHLL